MNFVEVTSQVAETTVLSVLEMAVGYPTPAKLAGIAETYRSNPCWSAYALVDQGLVLAVVGAEIQAEDSVRIRHIAVAQEWRRRGLGRRLIEELRRHLGATELYAETDADAAPFYERCGFSVSSLGERYPGVERFACRFSAA